MAMARPALMKNKKSQAYVQNPTAIKGKQSVPLLKFD